VLRRSPAQSRPPAAYSLARRGEYYEVWQRPGGPVPAIARHLPLGDFEDPSATPSCATVRRLARAAGPDGELAAVERAATIVAPGPAPFAVRVPAAARYGFYLLGSARNRLTLRVDGTEVGSVEQQLNADRQFLYFGSARLAAGPHEVELLTAGQGLGPGSGGAPEPLGPLVLSPVANEDLPVRRLPAARAAELCDQRLDWIEALP